MTSVRGCIVHSENSHIYSLAQSIFKVSQAFNWQMTIYSAREARIPHLTPLDLIFFGSEEGLVVSEEYFKELYRSLQGVNFAGKKGVLFSNSSRGIKALKEMVRDSELYLYSIPLICAKEPVEKDISLWLRNIEKEFLLGGRER